MQSWRGELVLAHPLIPLIMRIHNKVIQEQVTVVLIAPVWRSQYLWPTLERLCSKATVLGNNESVLKMGSRMKA